jgi:hypothetical protein
MGIDNLFEKLLGLDPGTAAGITLVLIFASVFIGVWKFSSSTKVRNAQLALAAQAQTAHQSAQIDINMKLIGLVKAQVDNNEAITQQMKKNEESYREVGKLISSLTSALTTFTRTVSDKMEGFGDSIKELESTIITHIEQEGRHHQAIVSSQTFNADGLTGLRNEISALTSQITALVNLTNTQDTADVGKKVDNLANEVRLLTQAVEAKQIKIENESKVKETGS